jgi:hypothetical protein
VARSDRPAIGTLRVCSQVFEFMDSDLEALVKAKGIVLSPANVKVRFVGGRRGHTQPPRPIDGWLKSPLTPHRPTKLCPPPIQRPTCSCCSAPWSTATPTGWSTGTSSPTTCSWTARVGRAHGATGGGRGALGPVLQGSRAVAGAAAI